MVSLYFHLVPYGLGRKPDDESDWSRVFEIDIGKGAFEGWHEGNKIEADQQRVSECILKASSGFVLDGFVLERLSLPFGTIFYASFFYLSFKTSSYLALP